MPVSKDERRLARLRFLAELLDSRFTGPFGFKFGLDPLIGLIPFFGDLITSLISFYIVVEAALMGCGFFILLRMVFNIFLEDFLKVIPVFGQIFDFYWKSNQKNITLLEEYSKNPEQVQKRNLLLFVLFFSIVLFIFILFFSVIYFLIKWICLSLILK